MTRAYQSTLRAEQTEQTRERILATFVEVLADPEVRDPTVPEVARRAGIAVRTAYRYFPTKDALYDALNDWWASRAKVSPPRTPEQSVAHVRALFVSFGEDETLVKAQRHSKPLQEARARRKPRQRAMLLEAFAPLVRHLDEREQRQAVAVIHSLMSADTFLAMRETWELTPEEAAEAAAWAIEALNERLRSRKPLRAAR